MWVAFRYDRESSSKLLISYTAGRDNVLGARNQKHNSTVSAFLMATSGSLDTGDIDAMARGTPSAASFKEAVLRLDALVGKDDNALNNRNRILWWRIVHDAAREDLRLPPNCDRIILETRLVRKRRGELTQDEARLNVESIAR